MTSPQTCSCYSVPDVTIQMFGNIMQSHDHYYHHSQLLRSQQESWQEVASHSHVMLHLTTHSDSLNDCTGTDVKNLAQSCDVVFYDCIAQWQNSQTQLQSVRLLLQSDYLIIFPSCLHCCHIPYMRNGKDNVNWRY